MKNTEKEGQGRVTASMFNSQRAFVLTECLCLNSRSEAEGHTYGKLSILMSAFYAVFQDYMLRRNSNEKLAIIEQLRNGEYRLHEIIGCQFLQLNNKKIPDKENGVECTVYVCRYRNFCYVSSSLLDILTTFYLLIILLSTKPQNK